MFPDAAFHNHADGAAADSERLGDILLHGAIGNCGADGDNLIFGQDGTMHGTRPMSAAPFSHTVGGIILIGAQEQMMGIDATGIIAPMQNPKPIRNSAISALIGFSGGAGFFEDSIPAPVFRSLPFPTFIDIVKLDLAPKADFGRDEHEWLLERPSNSTKYTVNSTVGSSAYFEKGGRLYE